MALKFLNKKGWHTGSLRNIENVWKAEQKHDAEQKKLEELRKQITEEREKAEFRLLQEQAGLVPRQERLEFLYESGLAVGKGSSSDAVFKALEPSDNNNTIPPPPQPSSSAVTQQQPSAPGALFEEKPQSANDAWRKLHSDPLLLIRQREQESLARVKNNPVQMAIIRNSVEAKKSMEKVSKSKEHREKKSRKRKSKHHKYSSSDEEEERVNDRANKRSSKGNEFSDKMDYVSEREQRKKHRRCSSPSVEEEERSTYTKAVGKSSKGDKMDYVSEREERDTQRRKHHRHHRDSSSVEEEERSKYKRKNSDKDERSYKIDDSYEKDERRRNSDKDNYRKQLSSATASSKKEMKNLDKPKYDQASSSRVGSSSNVNSNVNPRRPRHHVSSSSKLSAEERAARLKEMQIDAEVHEESRWKRLKKADEIDTIQEAAATMRNATSSNSNKNFLEAAKRSVYGAEIGGSATIEESVRRRTHYLQSKSEQGNAFRR